MRILICHGYLLRGTGSNQYVQSLARALCRQGHHLVLMCQDGDPRLDFVTTFLRERADGMSPQVVWEQETEYPGSCLVFKPDIGDLLPVYVLDNYQGFEVKEFPDLDDSELERYVEANRRAIARLTRQFVPDAIQVNHAVMLPYIVSPVARQADTPYFVSLHGSAIEFTVRKDGRFLRYGAEGLEGASGILAPSRHTADVAREVFGHFVQGLDSRIAIVPPGVDTELFTTTDRNIRRSVGMLLEAVEGRMSGVTVGDFLGNTMAEAVPEDVNQATRREADRINAQHPDWLPEPDIGDRLSPVDAEGRPFVMFLGKLLETKGIQCVLPALPLVMREHPEACLVVVGFGELRGVLELMLDALDQGDVRRLKSLCEYGNREYTRSGPLFTPVLTFLDELAGSGMLDEYLRLCRDSDLRDSVVFTG
ncbi:MAG: glycosyltransferase, partial [Actinobacteria bacterium]|nr:glycosyltransferase [Actinomycetota bacterium]